MEHALQEISRARFHSYLSRLLQYLTNSSSATLEQKTDLSQIKGHDLLYLDVLLCTLRNTESTYRDATQIHVWAA